ncbi:hypothetical protein BTO13_01640 [Polaribacter gangjinensis]|uniref:DUF3822 domain-containing protein n=1 Tax=Polaribacter gangjinensis TaxID=574710 RepID=A0A2S7WA03_9FLAO|nr:hypothetical protein BTO13_01640 [Polaribacter gangjinensis]
MKKSRSNISLKNTNNKILSIQFSLDGFSFCVSDLFSKEISYFADYTFDETVNSLENLLENIKTIFNEDPILHNEFSEVFIIHQNSLNTLVPDDYFDENSLSSYLEYNIKTLQTDFITFDSIAEIEAKNVYIPYVNINNYLFQNFGEFEYKHHTTILLEKLIQKNKSEEKVMFVNVFKNTFDITVLEHKKLILSNSFAYNTKEDFIYYILFVAEQLQLNNEEFKLYFTGEITIESDLYNIAFTYIKNVYFLESSQAIFKELDAKKHSNFILLG